MKASDVLTALSIFAPNKCQTQFPFKNFLSYFYSSYTTPLVCVLEWIVMRLKDATFACILCAFLFLSQLDQNNSDFFLKFVPLRFYEKLKQHKIIKYLAKDVKV